MLLMLLSSLSLWFDSVRYSPEATIFFSLVFALLALWVFMHPQAYIAVDKARGVFLGYEFGFKSREIPIAAITQIGIRGTFLGAMNVMTITYRKPDGKIVTIRSVSKQSYDKASFRNVMNAMTELNPRLTIPAELRA